MSCVVVWAMMYVAWNTKSCTECSSYSLDTSAYYGRCILVIRQWRCLVGHILHKTFWVAAPCFIKLRCTSLKFFVGRSNRTHHVYIRLSDDIVCFLLLKNVIDGLSRSQSPSFCRLLYFKWCVTRMVRAAAVQRFMKSVGDMCLVLRELHSCQKTIWECKGSWWFKKVARVENLWLHLSLITFHPMCDYFCDLFIMSRGGISYSVPSVVEGFTKLVIILAYNVQLFFTSASTLLIAVTLWVPIQLGIMGTFAVGTSPMCRFDFIVEVHFWTKDIIFSRRFRQQLTGSGFVSTLMMMKFTMTGVFSVIFNLFYTFRDW